MLEPFFCEGVASVQICVWTWRFIVGIALILIVWKILMPKKKDI